MFVAVSGRLSVSVCVFVLLIICPPSCMHASVLSTRVLVCLSAFCSLCLPACPSIYLSLSALICQSICLSVWLGLACSVPFSDLVHIPVLISVPVGLFMCLHLFLFLSLYAFMSLSSYSITSMYRLAEEFFVNHQRIPMAGALISNCGITMAEKYSHTCFAAATVPQTPLPKYRYQDTVTKIPLPIFIYCCL